MKKLFAVLLALVMLFALSASAMADMQTLSWLTARRDLEKTDLTGKYFKIADLDVDIWVPDLFKQVEEVSQNAFCAFAAENNSAVISVNHLTFDGDPSLEEIEKMAIDAGCESDGIFWINGFNALIYETKSEDSLSVLIKITDEGAMEITFAPVSNPDVYSVASLVLTSIQRHTLDVEDVALMMDADLNSFWGENKSVKYTDDDKEQLIHIAMWEDGVNSETINDVNNWDEVTDAKITLYNDYIDALNELGMGNVVLNLDYLSEDQDVTFFTIEAGEITYDAFADAA
ncbi:MAG: hypothetical protein IJ237_04975 [Oscillospiraceae bacterium]|nr:hypothetical protein [Oscillospiraceae bacterium]